jgi:hypothetical protein
MIEKSHIVGGVLIILFFTFCLYTGVSISCRGKAAFYDNTSTESKVNVSNMAPAVSKVNVYEQDDGSAVNIDLTEGTTETVVCNGTVDDWNGWADLAGVNATLYDADSYTSQSPNDNNYHYYAGSCTNKTINGTAAEFSCIFDVWYYANEATWNCNMSAIDIDNASANGVDPTPPSFNMLAALNLSTNVLDFGEMQPGNTTLDTDEVIVNVSNTGNAQINLSLDGFGRVDGDGLAMDCSSTGNISIGYLRYNYTASQDFDTSMWNLTDTALSSGIPGFSVLRRVDDADVNKLNSTNSTFWKIRIPGGAKGVCNGTVVFSAVV